MQITTKFNPQQHVMIDGSREIKATVLAVLVRGQNLQYDVAWLHNGSSCSAWIEEFRLMEWVEWV